MKTIDLIMGSDHRGLELKHQLLDYISPDDINGGTMFDVAVIQNLKPHEAGKSVDYPDVVKEFGKSFDIYTHGILVCGSGTGMAMSANKIKGIRAAVCYNLKSTRLSRQHNDANIISIGSRLTNKNTALKLVSAFLKTKFEGGRHQRRVKKI